MNNQTASSVGSDWIKGRSSVIYYYFYFSNRNDCSLQPLIHTCVGPPCLWKLHHARCRVGATGTQERWAWCHCHLQASEESAERQNSHCAAESAGSAAPFHLSLHVASLMVKQRMSTRWKSVHLHTFSCGKWENSPWCWSYMKPDAGWCRMPQIAGPLVGHVKVSSFSALQCQCVPVPADGLYKPMKHDEDLARWSFFPYKSGCMW